MSYRSRARYQITFGGPISKAVKILLLANVLVFCFQLLEGIAGSFQLTSLLGLQPTVVWQHLQLWRLVTYMFLHGGFFHIFFNLLSLYFFGPELERLWGTHRFYKYYFITGVGAAMCKVLIGPLSQTITIGASGAIYGVLLAYALHFPNRPVYIYFIFPVKVKYMVTAMVVMTFFASFSGSGDGIDHWTHLSGLVIGFLYLMGWQYLGQLDTLYRRWKLKKAKKKFRVYYQETRNRSHGEDKPPTIH